MLKLQGMSCRHSAERDQVEISGIVNDVYLKVQGVVDSVVNLYTPTCVYEHVYF